MQNTNVLSNRHYITVSGYVLVLVTCLTLSHTN